MTQPVNELLSLSGKVAIVTGGGKGIGCVISLRLAEAGAAVMITDIDLPSAENTVHEITGKGGKAQALLADASKATDANLTIDATMQAFGQVDILVNNAGIFPPTPTLDMGEEAWDKILDVNLNGVFFYSQAAAKEMIKAGGGGKIINLASTEGMHPNFDMVAYNAAKGALLMLTKSLALNLAGYNILVNAIAPGAVETPGNQWLLDVIQSSEEIANMFWMRFPLGRMAQSDDVAKMVLALASPLSDYMTGSVVVVDGGVLVS